ncbi:16S rRNA (guanine(527)-N(7))-methyltransferase RsmG [Ideonella sp. 4Y11]|uniref:Ribosomal RNA small subunit methyltransferase G n=1 Tax=Ideonella aquatica TaxID=2824119 RepID=A0A941BI71_9BURK|nr:16S rRNA (guanine(527)-N(7))-methyltransferase RsmG [Ideonella aquatica]
MSHPQAAALERGIAALGLTLPEAAPAQLLAYLDLIARWNQVYNLTAVRDPQQMLTQHLLDCLAVVQPLRQQAAALDHADDLRLLDVGSGAGLPGVVLAIANPGWAITCVDTVAKKATFIRQVGAELGLRQLQAVHQRVEDMSTAPFSMITSRAFASLVDFVHLTRERLAPGGCWAAMKAHLTDEERQAVPADVEMFHVERLAVPGLDAERCIVWMRATV